MEGNPGAFFIPRSAMQTHLTLSVESEKKHRAPRAVAQLFRDEPTRATGSNHAPSMGSMAAERLGRTVSARSFATSARAAVRVQRAPAEGDSLREVPHSPRSSIADILSSTRKASSAVWTEESRKPSGRRRAKKVLSEMLSHVPASSEGGNGAPPAGGNRSASPFDDPMQTEVPAPTSHEEGLAAACSAGDFPKALELLVKGLRDEEIGSKAASAAVVKAAEGASGEAERRGTVVEMFLRAADALGRAPGREVLDMQGGAHWVAH